MDQARIVDGSGRVLAVTQAQEPELKGKKSKAPKITRCILNTRKLSSIWRIRRFLRVPALDSISMRWCWESQVASSAYDLRRQFEQNVESSCYDVVLESNSWRVSSKPIYVLTQDENRLLTMRTRRARSEVESELNMLFSKLGSRRGRQERSSSRILGEDAGSENRFRMLVEDVREGVLVFEDVEVMESSLDIGRNKI
ncbi:hypothetical protein R1sor_000557 [Riccia sorocarpa]|uniref:Uncharacterized protein n=1 Tax=Riccia sorocarpa TaxID=122646 RepID=A0ABD3GWL3_9MARC